MSPGLGRMNPEQAVQYLDQKYYSRFTMEDPLFVDALNRQISNPPIEINYTGRIRREANRSYNRNITN